MKNKFIYIARMAALPLLLAATACEDTLIAPAPGIAGDGPTLTLTLDNNEEKAGTRSELTSSAPTNHVTTVRILVFQQMTDGAEPVYVGQEPQDIDWLNYGGETVAVGQRSRITYQLNYPFEKGATYTLLGVAMDENFDDDYTLEVEGKTRHHHLYPRGTRHPHRRPADETPRGRHPALCDRCAADHAKPYQ